MRFPSGHNHQRTYQKMEHNKDRHKAMINGEQQSVHETSLFARIISWSFGVLIVAAILYFIFIF